MLPTYYPTSLKCEEEPASFRVGYFEEGKLQYQHFKNFPGFRGPDYNDTEQSLIDADLGCIDFYGFAIPLKTGVFVLPGSKYGDVRTGYNMEKNQIEVFKDNLTPKIFNDCNGTFDVKSLVDIMAMALLSGAKIPKTSRVIRAPNGIQFNFLTKVGEKNKQLNSRSMFSHPYAVEDVTSALKAVVHYNKTWCEYVGGTVVEMTTGKLIAEDVDLADCLIVIPDESIWCYPHRSDFEFTNKDNGVQRYQMVVNVPCTVSDPRMGEILFENLGIDFDIYENVTLGLDGRVDPKTFMEGSLNFGVIKTTGWFFDVDAYDRDYPEAKAKLEEIESKEGEGKSKKFSFRKFSSRHEEDVGRNRIGASNGAYAVFVETIEDFESFSPNYFANNWKLNRVLGPIYKFKAIGRDFESREELEIFKADLIRQYMVKKDFSMPIFTPRFSEDTNAKLNAFRDNATFHFANHNSIVDITEFTAKGDRQCAMYDDEFPF